MADSVIGYALARRVIPVSPNTFYAYLAAVLHGLKGLAVEAHAREILDSLGALGQDVARFQRTLEVLDTHLANARKQCDEAARMGDRLAERLAGLTGERRVREGSGVRGPRSEGSPRTSDP